MNFFWLCTLDSWVVNSLDKFKMRYLVYLKKFLVQYGNIVHTLLLILIILRWRRLIFVVSTWDQHISHLLQRSLYWSSAIILDTRPQHCWSSTQLLHTVLLWPLGFHGPWHDGWFTLFEALSCEGANGGVLFNKFCRPNSCEQTTTSLLLCCIKRGTYAIA